MSGRQAPDAARLAASAFGIAALAAVGVVVVYASGGDTQLEGVGYCVAFGALGAGLVVWANGLLADGPHEEERHALRGEPAEAAIVDDELTRGGALARRAVLRRALAFAGGAIGLAVLTPLRSLGPAPGRRALRTAWADGVRVVTADGTAVRVDDVPVDGLVTVFPEHDVGSADGQVVMVRVDPAILTAAPGRRDWAPEGIVAFSKVCTHAGCPVGLYQAESHRLVCPCHQSAFDVLRGARPVAGPAAWPLPQLPLAVASDGTLHATGGLSAPVGPGWWRE